MNKSTPQLCVLHSTKTALQFNTQKVPQTKMQHFLHNN